MSTPISTRRYLRIALSIFKKDFMVEMRSREVLFTMFFFAIVVVVVFTFSFLLPGESPINFLPGIFWVAVVFSGTIAINRSFEREREHGCIDGMLLSSTPPSAIYLSKTISNILFTLAMEAFLIPIVVVFFNIASIPDGLRLAAILFLGTVGFCVVGTLFSAMLVNARMKHILLPIIFYPLVAPLLITCVKATSGLFVGVDDVAVNNWIRMALAFDMLFIVAGLWLFPYLIEEGPSDRPQRQLRALVATRRRRFDGLYLAFLGVVLGAFLTLMIAVFFVAPLETQMGIVQKIFYLHVPSAINMFLAFGVCALASLAFLVCRSHRENPGLFGRLNNFFVARRSSLDALASSGAEIGLMFATIVLVTGPLWGRKAWGTYWEWDPRLTLTLLLFLIYSGYLFLRAYAGNSESRQRIAAGLGVMGFLDVPLIHYAVVLWGGTHPNVMNKGGGGIQDPKMRMAFMLGMLTVFLLFLLLLWTRYGMARQRREMDALFGELIDAELEREKKPQPQSEANRDASK